MPTPEQFGRATLFYPLVGALMGGGLYALGYFFGETYLLLHAALSRCRAPLKATHTASSSAACSSR
ncbi:hypothetical protein [Pseudomonas sp. UMC76]|uniref:hypothetical protein n=1 Tax=Pseudomonas sp. UMC76 TaxID=1862324 RepID=UPI0038F64F61